MACEVVSVLLTVVSPLPKGSYQVHNKTQGHSMEGLPGASQRTEQWPQPKVSWGSNALQAVVLDPHRVPNRWLGKQLT
jgi:hypothetical protein